MQRRTIHFTGHVQGVGFRFRARQIAQTFAVRGFVRNLDDGRVELVVEGDPPEIDRLVAAIADAMSDFIRRIDQHSATATQEFNDFRIEH